MKQDMRKQQINGASTQSSNATACGSNIQSGQAGYTYGFGHTHTERIHWTTVTVCTSCKSPVNALAKRVGMTMINAL